MTPTLAGRLQTRLLIALVIGLPVTVVLGTLLGLGAGRAAEIGLVIGGLSLLWELLWHGAQQLRWDKDWPSILAFLVGVPEALVGKVVLSWLSVLPLHMDWGTYNILFAASWVLGWLLQQGPLRVLFPSWRFEGGRLLARRSLAAASTAAAPAKPVVKPMAEPVGERLLVTAGASRSGKGPAGSSGTPTRRTTPPSARPSSSRGPGRSRRTHPVASTRRRRPLPVLIGVGALALVFGVFAVIGLGTDQHGSSNAPADVAGAAHPQPAHRAPATTPTGPKAQAWQAPASQQVSDTWNTHKLVQPYAVTIPRLKLQQATQPVGLTAAKTIEEAAPGRIGWYQSTRAPGQTGPAVLLGPLGGHAARSVLGGLGHLVKGDTVLVTRTDSTTVQYLVDRVMKVKSSAFPAAQVYQKSTGSTLRLIGYGGTGASAHDVIVFATATHLLSPKSGS